MTWTRPRIISVHGSPRAVADPPGSVRPWPPPPLYFGCTTPGCPSREHYRDGLCRRHWWAREGALDALTAWKVARGYRPEDV